LHVATRPQRKCQMLPGIRLTRNSEKPRTSQSRWRLAHVQGLTLRCYSGCPARNRCVDFFTVRAWPALSACRWRSWWSGYRADRTECKLKGYSSDNRCRDSSPRPPLVPFHHHSDDCAHSCRMRGQRSPGRLVGGYDHECRWQSSDRCGHVSGVLQHRGRTLSHREVDWSCHSAGTSAWPTDRLQAERADHRSALLRSCRCRHFTRHKRVLEHGERTGSPAMTDRLGRLLPGCAGSIPPRR